jgi:hypothetical protein
MAGSSHGVGGQALGYLHQCLWALVELGRRAGEDPGVELRLEQLDDIQFDKAGTPVELLQTKHHTSEQSTVSINSVDLWRTLNVWMDAPDLNGLILRLITTSAINDDSDLAGLRAGPTRDVDTVIAALLVVGQSSENQTTAPWRARFCALDEQGRERLVDRIVIEDGSPKSTELDVALLKTFRFAASGNPEVFIELLKGWWAGIAVRLLDGSLTAVTGHDLVIAVTDMVDQLRSDTLPLDPAVMLAFDESEAGGYESRCFVQQLLWIALDETRLWKAVRDYHRSFTQRSFWLRYQLVSETEIDRFAFQLHDEWEQVFDRRTASLQQDGQDDRERVGREILEELARESRARVRERFEHAWFNRGMFHALADGELLRQIGWHPDFEEKLEEMLADVTA